MSKPQDGFVSRVLNRPQGPSGSNLRFDPWFSPVFEKKESSFSWADRSSRPGVCRRWRSWFISLVRKYGERIPTSN